MPFIRIENSLYNTDTILSIDVAEGGDATAHFIGGSQRVFPGGDFQILEKFLDIRPPLPKPNLFS